MSADRATRHYQYGGSPANWAGSIVALIGFIMAAASLQTGVRFVSLFLFATGAYSANS